MRLTEDLALAACKLERCIDVLWNDEQSGVYVSITATRSSCLGGLMSVCEQATATLSSKLNNRLSDQKVKNRFVSI